MMKRTAVKYGLRTVSPQINIPKATAKQNAPNQRRMASPELPITAEYTRHLSETQAQNGRNLENGGNTALSWRAHPRCRCCWDRGAFPRCAGKLMRAFSDTRIKGKDYANHDSIGA